MRLLLAPRVFGPLIREHLAAGTSTAATLEHIRASARASTKHNAALSAWNQQPSATEWQAHQSWLEGDKQGFLACTDPCWPASLRELSGAPVGLYWRGDPDLLSQPQLAIVGSRNPTPAGIRHATQFARQLAAHGLGIVSGLALGIDTAAHRGALQAEGMTIAVCGCGLDRCYPASNRKLFDEIAAEGLLLSEYIPGTPPARQHFPARNRIIAGLSLGTLVVEATQRSGSLISARQALNYGREVFAIPGSIDSPLSRGCHQLLREGAHLAECLQDIVEPLGLELLNYKVTEPGSAQADSASHLADPATSTVLAAMDEAPVSIDELATRTGLPVTDISSMLLILELQGTVALAPGGGYQRIK